MMGWWPPDPASTTGVECLGRTGQLQPAGIFQGTVYLLPAQGTSDLPSHKAPEQLRGWRYSTLAAV